MFIDSSALVAVMMEEKDAVTFLEQMAVADSRFVSAAVVWEVVVNLAKKRSLTIPNAQAELQDFLEEFEIGIVPISPDAGFAALDALDGFGKGRHPASLNFGDCLSYGCAKVLNQPLLFKGSDFNLTDVDSDQSA